MVRELGSERCETVWSISGVSVRVLREAFLSTRGLGRTHLWCTSYSARSKRWVAMCGADNCWKHLSRKPISRWVLSAKVFFAIGHSKRNCSIGVKCKVSNDFSWDTLTGLVSLIKKKLKNNKVSYFCEGKSLSSKVKFLRSRTQFDLVPYKPASRFVRVLEIYITRAFMISPEPLIILER